MMTIRLGVVVLTLWLTFLLGIVAGCWFATPDPNELPPSESRR